MPFWLIWHVLQMLNQTLLPLSPLLLGPVCNCCWAMGSWELFLCCFVDERNRAPPPAFLMLLAAMPCHQYSDHQLCYLQQWLAVFVCIMQCRISTCTKPYSGGEIGREDVQTTGPPAHTSCCRASVCLCGSMWGVHLFLVSFSLPSRRETVVCSCEMFQVQELHVCQDLDQRNPSSHCMIRDGCGWTDDPALHFF